MISHISHPKRNHKLKKFHQINSRRIHIRLSSFEEKFTWKSCHKNIHGKTKTMFDCWERKKEWEWKRKRPSSMKNEIYLNRCFQFARCARLNKKNKDCLVQCWHSIWRTLLKMSHGIISHLPCVRSTQMWAARVWWFSDFIWKRRRKIWNWFFHQCEAFSLARIQFEINCNDSVR